MSTKRLQSLIPRVPAGTGLVRFRTRTLMIAVAVVGLVLASWHFWRLSRVYRQRAEQYAGDVIWEGDGTADLEARQRMSAAEWDAYIQKRSQEIDRWRAQMEAKYRRAARYPWLPVAPDPPPPG